MVLIWSPQTDYSQLRNGRARRESVLSTTSGEKSSKRSSKKGEELCRPASEIVEWLRGVEASESRLHTPPPTRNMYTGSCKT